MVSSAPETSGVSAAPAASGMSGLFGKAEEVLKETMTTVGKMTQNMMDASSEYVTSVRDGVGNAVNSALSNIRNNLPFVNQ